MRCTSVVEPDQDSAVAEQHAGSCAQSMRRSMLSRWLHTKACRRNGQKPSIRSTLCLPMRPLGSWQALLSVPSSIARTLMEPKYQRLNTGAKLHTSRCFVYLLTLSPVAFVYCPAFTTSQELRSDSLLLYRHLMHSPKHSILEHVSGELHVQAVGVHVHRGGPRAGSATCCCFGTSTS